MCYNEPKRAGNGREVVSVVANQVISEEIMNKSEFIRAYADKLGVTIKEADANFNALVETLTDSLKNGEYIHISGFATFEIKDKAARDGVNPLTGEKVQIKACKAPAVKFSKTFKDVFNQ